MALTRRKINSLYEEKETSAAKQEKLDRFRAGYLKDTSAALPETKNPPVKISAGGFTEQAGGDIRSDLMQAADATRNAKSGNAASAALQGIGMYSKELPEKQEENKSLQNVGYIAEHIPEGIRAGIENVGTGIKSIVGAAGTALDRAVGQKEAGGLKLPTLKTGTKPTARTYSDTQKYGVEDYSSPVKAVTTSAATELMKNAEKYSKADEQEARLSAIKEKYSDADIGAVTQLLADITYSAGYTLPADVAGLLAGPAGTAVVMGTAAFGDALAEGMKKGYTRDNALQYALKETLNQAAMETLFDIAGGGIAEGKIMSAIDGIPNAVGRAAAKIGATGVGEGVEEVAQSIISTVNQKTSGDKETEVDLSELGYEFLVGSLAGALRGAPVQAAQTIMESRSKPDESTSAQENTPIEVDNTTTETADVQTAKTEQNVPVSEDVAKTSETVAKTEETAAISDEENNVEEDIETFDETVDEDSPVAKSLRIAETDVYTAGNELVNAYGGDVRKAVDALYAEGNRLVKDGSAEARAKLSTVEAVRSDILSNNAKRVERNAEHLRKTLTQYGIKNVTVDMSLADKGVNGYYVPGSKTIAVSPKLSGQDAVNFVVAHELGHHAAAADSTLVNDIVGIESALMKRGMIPEGRYAPARYMEAYAAEAQRHAASASGQAELKAHMDSGMTKEQAVQRIVEDYIHQEMASDILGELVKNPDILKRLKREDRTLWQRIVDALKDLAAKLTGKTETRQQEKMLETIRGILEDVSGETVERRDTRNVSAEGDVRMSKDITQDDVSVLRSIGRKSVNEFTSDDIAKTEKWARKFYSELGEKSPFFRAWFGDWREHDTTRVPFVSVNAESIEKGEIPRGEFHNADTKWDIRSSSDGADETAHKNGKWSDEYHALKDIESMLENAVLLDSVTVSEPSKRLGNDAVFMHHLYCPVSVSGQKGVAKLYVAESYTDDHKFYLLKIEKTSSDMGLGTGNGTPTPDSGAVSEDADISIAEIFDFVKKHDAQFEKNSSHPVRFSPKPSSEIRNEDGTPKVMYHGTKEQFTVFDKKKAKSSGLYGKGFYFTGSESHSGQYGDSMAVYLDIKRPLSPDTDTVTEDQIRTFLEAVAENEDYSIENYGTYDVDEILDGITSRDMFGVLQDINATAIGNFVEAVELFNEVNGTEYDGIVVPTETVAFRANQIKSATDNVGTFDSGNADIRFSMELPVEESGELVAIHNLSESKLKKASELGGFAMPSIAIVRASDGHEEFGEISAVFGKDTIDPEFISKNKVYSGDAWTPTYPRVEYKVDEKVRKQVEKKIKSLVPYEIMSELGRVSLDSSNIEDTVNRFNGDMVEAYRNDSAMKYAYLKDTGSDISLPMKEAPLYQYGELSNEAVRYFAGKLVNGLQTVELYQNMSSGEMLQDKELKEAVADAQNYDVLRTFEPGSDEYIAYEQKPVFRADEVAFRDINNILAACRKLFTTGVQKTVDSGAAKGIIDEQTEQSAYEAWLREQFAGIVEKEGIRNNVDYFTPSGNRRSFEALHWENTLENVVRAMKETGEKGIGSFGGGNIFGASTKEFSSIEEVRKAKERLQNIPQEEYEKMKDEFRERFFDLASSLPENKGSFSAADDAANMLVEAVAKYKTKNGMANYIRRESQGWAKYSPQVVDELIDIVNDIRSMPTGYFEAKPQRAVGFDEVRAFIVPDNIQDDTRAVLEGIGKPVVEYIAGDKKSRVDALNSVPEARFSREVFTEEEKAKFKLEEQRKFVKRQYTTETAFGPAVAASPGQRKEFSTEVAHGLPGVTIEMVERAIAPVWDVFEKAKGGSDDTVQSRVEQAYAKAQVAAEDLISRVTAKRINPQYEQYFDLRKRLRTTPIRNDVSVQEFGGAEDYAEWRKKNKGLLRISDSADAVGIDVLYSELCETYPEFFPKEIENPSDMLKRLGEVAVELKNTASMEKVDYDPLEGYKQEAANELADRIMLGFQQYSSMTLNAKNRLESEKAEKRIKDMEQESQKAFQMQQKEHERQTASIVRDFNSSINKLVKEVDRQNQKIDRLTTTLTGRNANLMLAAEKKRFLGNLNKLYTMLTEPNKKKHIPETMKRDVAELLKQFEGIVLTDKKFVDAKLLDSIVHSVPDMQIENGDIRVDDPFVSSLKNDLDILNGIRETIASDQMDPNTQQETLVRMNTDYMRAANTILKKLNGYIMTRNQLFIDGKIQEADVFSDDLISDLAGRKRYAQGDTKSTFGGTLKNVGRNFADKLHYEAMNAGLFFEMIGESGIQLDHTFRKGQDKQAAHEKEFASYMKRITGGKYNTFAAAGLGGGRIQVSIDGHDIDVSKAQLMSLYLLWKRPAARRHLEAQGAVFTDANGKEFEARTFVITQGTMDELIKHLSEEDIRVADAMQRFLAHQCSEWGNEASMQMYGYRMYEDPDYFPIRVSETVKMRNAPAWGAQIGDISLENSGFTKHVDRNSTSAIVVGNVFDITENHVKRMASYNAYAPICNDLQRVLSRSEVRGAIIRGLGDKGLRYIDNFLKNVNDNKVMQKETSGNYAWMQFLGNMSKRAAVSYNISTAVKQPLSILRVFNEMDPAFVLQAMTSKGLDARVYQSPEYKRLYDTMVENSGVAKMKMLGYSDAGFAKSLRQQWDDNAVNTDGALRSVMTAGKVTRAVTKGYDRITDFGMKGAAWADERTWVTIWKSCELETAKKYHSLSAEERLSKTTERFGEIIGRTQVVDSLLDTTPFKEGTIGTGLGAFMNEPVKQYANLVVAVDGLKNGKKGARKKLAVVLATTLANSLILEPMVSAIFSGFRDEEDDSDQAFRKFVKNYLGIDLTDKSEGVKATDIASSQFVDGLVGIVPIVGEIYGIIADALAGYDNTRFETDGLQQVVQSVTSLFTGGESKTTGKKVSELLSAVGMITGIPYKTLSRDIRAVFRNFYNATDNHLAAWNMNKLYYNIDSSSARSGKNFYDIMAHAYKEGDTEAYQQMRKELAEIPTSSSFGVSQKTITDNIEKRGGEVTVGSQLWYVDLQSSFHLDYFNKGMVPERMITEVYRKTKDNSVLPSPPSNTFTVNGESVEIEDPIQQELFAAEVGDFSYRILMNMASSDAYRNLNDAQKQYAIEKVYDYARKRSRKKLYKDYDMNNNAFTELFGKNATPSDVSNAILKMARDKKE